MFKKLAFVSGSLFLMLVVACADDNVAGGGTIDPSTFAQESSSSMRAADIESSSEDSETKNGLSFSISSSSDAAYVPKDESSSSCEDCGNDIAPIVRSSSSLREQSDVVVTARNFSLKCSEDVVHVDPEEPAVSKDVLAPYASKSIAADSVNVLISDYFKIPCDKSEAKAFVDEVNESEKNAFDIAGDTLYVDIARSKSFAYECTCVALVKFTLDVDYSGLQYTVFDKRKAILLEKLK